MSHVATSWAIRQRGLKPASRIVLWTLADCHNPTVGCFPSQKYLADACEMSRSTVNLHLAALEKRGLIRRDQGVEEATKRQRPTRYFFRFEEENPVSEIRTGDTTSGASVSENETRTVSEIRTVAVSEKPAEPCPKNGDSRVRNPDTNLVREPVREPVNAADEARASAKGLSFFDKVLDVVGINRNAIPTARWMPPKAEAEVNAWRDIAPGVLTESLILDHVAESRRRFPNEPPSGPKAFERGLRELAGTLSQPPPTPLAPRASDRPHRVLTPEEMRAAMNRSWKEA